MMVTPVKQLALFIQMPEEALRHLLHTASKFSTAMNACPISTLFSKFIAPAQH